VDAPVSDRRDASQHARRVEEVESADFVVRSPAIPVARMADQDLVQDARLALVAGFAGRHVRKLPQGIQARSARYAAGALST